MAVRSRQERRSRPAGRGGTNVVEDPEWTDVVVTGGGGSAGPDTPGKRYVDWQLGRAGDRSAV